MKKNLLIFLLLAIIPAVHIHSQVIYQESFETDGSGGVRYTLNFPHGNDGGYEDYFERSDSTGFKGFGMDMLPEGEDGDYFIGFEDLDGVPVPSNDSAVITLNPVNVSAATSIKVKLLLAANPVTNKFDRRDLVNGDFVDVQVNLDGGGWTTIGSFCSPDVGTGSNSGYMYYDKDMNGVGGDNGEFINLTNIFREFILDVPGTGTSLEVRVIVRVEAGDEEVALDDIRIYNDNEAPIFSPGYPKADDIQQTQFDVVMNLDEPGICYYLLMENNAPPPTKADVMAGNAMDIPEGRIDYSTTISSLTANTDYDVYFIAIDDEGIPNEQDAPTLLEVKTLEPESIELTYPAGGENFFIGDTIDLTWNSLGVDSIDLYFWFEIPGFGSMFVQDETQDRFEAAPGTAEFILNPALSADSTRFMIQDYEDPGLADTSGWFYLTDTTYPGIMATYPANKATDVLRSDSLGISFNEFMKINEGSVKIYNEDGTLFDSIHVPSDQVVSMLDVIFSIYPGKMFENDSSYYVLIDSVTFTDRAGNAFRGITEDTTWTFTVNDPRSLDLTFPVGGENFYVGDTIIIRWTSDGLDSIQLWARGFEEQTWYPVLGEEDMKVWAEQDTVILPIPLSAGLDSTYFRINWADDFGFFDECGIFYLTDTIKPSIHELEPANKDSNVVINPLLILKLDERAFKGTGNIIIKKKADDSVQETIPVTSEQVAIGYDEIHIGLGQPLERGITYYVIVEAGAFMDFQDNIFDGITDDTTWTFTTIGPDLFISEYIEGGASRKALELYNPTGETLYLDDYRIAQSANGGGWAYYHYFPGGSTLAPGEFYIMLSDDNTFTDTTYFDPADADEILSAGGSAVSFNGNDARAIEKNTGGEWMIIDIFGDPNSADNYDVAGISGAAKDHSLLRKDFIMYGNDDWPSSAGTNAFNSEWKVLDKDYFDNLGMLTMPSDTLAEIDSFYLAEQTLPAVIDSAAATIAVEVALGTKLDSLFPYIEVSPNAGVEPASGDSVDFSGGPVDFTVTAEDRQHLKVWTVTVTEKTIPSSENDIVTFVLTDETKAATIDAVNHTVSAEVAYGISLTALEPTITVSAMATIDPETGVAQDFTNPVNYTVTAQDGTEQVWEVTVTVQQPIAVATIAELRAGTVDNTTLYELTGEVILTHAVSYRNWKYVQDATGGIEIDDDQGKITTSYNVGDGISGLIGTLSEYHGLLDFNPVEDPGAPTSTGNTITPLVVTVADFVANHNDYEGELVTLRGVTFPDAGNNFVTLKNYDLQQGTDVTVFRTHFTEADYIGTAIPSGKQVVTGIAIEYDGTAEIAARSAADIVALILSDEKDILTFVLAEQTEAADINATDKTVEVLVPVGTDLSSLTPTITVSDLATIDPASGVTQDFTSPVTYTVTAEDGSTQDWSVTINFAIGIDQKYVNNLFEIYPNPSQGRFTFKLSAETSTEFEISITSLSGQVMLIRTIEVMNDLSETLDLTHFDAGIYLMKVRTSEELQIQKLIIQ